MLKINNNFKKCKMPLITMTIVASGIFLFQYLTFIPEYSSAEEISTDTPVTITPTTPLAKWEDLQYMQQMTPQACENANIGNSKTLTDSRDSSTYTIKKLNDGKCWMTQNLRIVNKAITSADSDVTSNYTIPASSSPWSDTAADTNKVHYANNTTYGAYYSWYTTTAGSSITTDGQNAPSSICPKGWRLPIGGNNSEFQILYDKGFTKVGNFTTNSDSGYWFGGVANTSGAAFFPANGFVANSSLDDVGNDGRYWSSTANSASKSFNLYFASSSVSLSASNFRFNGLSIRCIAKTTSTEIPVDPSKPTGSGVINPNVSVTVDKILTMEVSNKEVNIEPKTNEIMTGNFTATVSSNAGYDIGLSAAEDSNTALVNKKDNVVIAEIPASNNIQVGDNGWGIKCIDDKNCTLKSYNALTLYNNPQIYFSSENGVFAKAAKFEVGIGISPSLPSGTYSTNILVTASQK